MRTLYGTQPTMSSRKTRAPKTRAPARKPSTWESAAPEEPRDRLSRGRIVAAAIAIADEEGLAAVSIRNVADRLGSSPMALYNHVPNKQDLLNLMLDAAHAELTLRPDSVSNWRDAFTEVAWEMRRSLQRHPWLAAIRSGDPEHGPGYMRAFEFALAMGRQFGIAPEAAARILGALFALASGFAPSESGRELPILSRSVLGSGDYPVLAHLVSTTTAPVGDARFAEVVAWLLDGAAANLNRGGSML
jgi:AcrR family transcriptional regulator